MAETDRGRPLVSLTLVCVSGASGLVEIERVDRNLVTPGGATVEAFTTEGIELPGSGRTQCHELKDSLETTELDPGLYEISASARTQDEQLEGRAVEFTVQHGSR